LHGRLQHLHGINSSIHHKAMEAQHGLREVVCERAQYHPFQKNQAPQGFLDLVGLVEIKGWWGGDYRAFVLTTCIPCVKMKTLFEVPANLPAFFFGVL
jgi:hypothetical protein